MSNTLLFKLFDKHPKMTLQEFGFLSLMLEVKGGRFDFPTREGFIDYCRLKTNAELSKILGSLILKEIIVETKKDGNHIYTINLADVVISVPMKYTENRKLSQYVDSQMNLFDTVMQEKLIKILNDYKKYISANYEDFTLDHAERFFSVFQGFPRVLFFQFLRIYYKRPNNTFNLDYIRKIIENLRVENKIITEKKVIQEQKKIEVISNIEDDFAKMVANGSAVGNVKYEILIKKKNFSELRKCYQKGKKLLQGENLYEGYDWL